MARDRTVQRKEKKGTGWGQSQAAGDAGWCLPSHQDTQERRDQSGNRTFHRPRGPWGMSIPRAKVLHLPQAPTGQLVLPAGQRDVGPRMGLGTGWGHRGVPDPGQRLPQGTGDHRQLKAGADKSSEWP